MLKHSPRNREGYFFANASANAYRISFRAIGNVSLQPHVFEDPGTMNASTSGKNTRRVAPEYAKAIGAIGICWFHFSDSSRWMTYWCLPMFMVLALGFPKRARTWGEWSSQMRLRAHRLLRPWLIWSAIYALLMMLKASLGSEGLFDWVKPSMLVMGTALHLWFLPYLWVLWGTTSAIGVQCNATGMRRVWLRGCLYTLSLTVVPLTSGCTRMPPPIAQWIYLLPCAIGACGLSLALLNEPRRRAWMEGLVLGAGMVAIGLLGYRNGIDLGVGMIVGTIALHIARTGSIQLTDWAFVVYLIHPAVGALCKLVLKTPDQSDVLAIVTIVLSSLCATLLCRSLLAKRWLLAA